MVGIAVGDAGAVALNVVLTETRAFIENSDVTSARDVSVTAGSTSEIAAVVAGVSAAIGVGFVGLGVSIGISIAWNYIGYDAYGNDAAGGVSACVIDSSIDAAGALTQTAIANQTISAVVFAFSAAIAGGFVGIAAAGSGVIVENKIAMDVLASIDGDGGSGTDLGGISASSISLLAQDTSTISSLAAAVSIAFSLGFVGVSVSIGVTVASNHIATSVQAFIRDAGSGVTSESGNIVVTASSDSTINSLAAAASIAASAGFVGIAVSGAGAVAENTILTATNAFAENSVLTSAGDVLIDASSASLIRAINASAAVSLAGGGVGVGVSIGLTLARNYIGNTNVDSTPSTYTTDDEPAQVNRGDTVRIANGVRGGDVYEYLGDQPLVDNRGQQLTFTEASLDAMRAAGLPEDLVNKLDSMVGERFESRQGLAARIRQLVTEEELNDHTFAIMLDQTDELVGPPVTYRFTGASLDRMRSAGFAEEVVSRLDPMVDETFESRGDLGARVKELVTEEELSEYTLGILLDQAELVDPLGTYLNIQDYGDSSLWKLVSVSRDAAPIQAYVKNSSIDAEGDLEITATATQKIQTLVLAGSVAIAAGGLAGVGVSGAGSVAENRIATWVRAFIDGDGANGIEARSITIEAHDSSSIWAVVGSASVAAALGGGLGISVSIAVAVAYNEVANDVAAYIANADDVTTTGGGVSITATSSGEELFDLSGVTAAQLDDLADERKDDPDTEGVDEEALDRADETAVKNAIAAQFAGQGQALSGEFRFSKVDEGHAWVLADEDGKTYFIRVDDGQLSVSRSTITAYTVAASLGAGIGGLAGIAVSGAGAIALNVVLTETRAYIANSDVTSAGNVSLSAASTSEISAIIAALSAAVGVGGGVGVGVSIGISIARNFIGYDAYGNDAAGGVRAYVIDSSIDAAGTLTQTAIANQTISALVFSISAAIAAGGLAGIGASGSGVSAQNKIGQDVEASIDGDGGSGADLGGISATSITLTASDTSTISALAGAASVALSLAGAVGVGISVGVALSWNTIDTTVTAFIRNADGGVTSETGNIDIRAASDSTINSIAAAASVAVGVAGLAGVAISGAGASAQNTILTATNAFAEDSKLTSAGDVLIDAASSSIIRAINASASISVGVGGAAGVGVSIGLALARNNIGFINVDSTPSTYTTDDVVSQVNRGNTVRIANGVRGGDVYEYVGEEPLIDEREPGYMLTEGSLDAMRADGIRDDVVSKLSPMVGEWFESLEGLAQRASELLTAEEFWDHIGGMASRAELADSPVRFLNIQDYGDIALWKLVSVDVDAAPIQAYTKNSSISAVGDLEMTATANQEIRTLVLAGSVAIAAGGAVGVGLSGAGSVAENRIATWVRAFIDGDGDDGIHADTITITAHGSSRICAVVGAASVAAALSGGVGVSISIAVAFAYNEIANDVAAYIANADDVNTTDGDVTISATSAGGADLFNLGTLSTGQLDDASEQDQDNHLVLQLYLPFL